MLAKRPKQRGRSSWARQKTGAARAPVDVETGQKTQSWPAVSDDPAALVSGRYWHRLQQQELANQATDPSFQDELIDKLDRPTEAKPPAADRLPALKKI
ncbi:hypothetical protein CI41S_17720 [Bradyrhizobium ivorense]|nr:hypothetical protein CI41S_17720 [Bradyrhizobium ivorense]